MDSTARAQLNEQMRRLADGDRSAFEPVYASLWPPVRAFCRRALAEGDAEDAAQHALIKVFDRAATFVPEGDALTWALAIATWECRTIRRKRQRSRETTGGDDEVATIDTAPSPERRLIEADLAAAATSVLGTLSPADRETLQLTMDDETATGVPAATFRKRRERALDRLRAAWRRVHGT